MSTQQLEDPFAGADSVPSVSFKDVPVGTSYTGTVTEAPKLVQARDFDSGNPAFWPDGGQKMTVVTRLLIDGEERSLWAAKPSAMYRAIADAQKAVGAQLAVGGKLTVTFSGEKPNEKNPRLNPQKLYTVTYTPPDAFTTPPPARVDPWQAPPQAAPAPQQPAPLVFTDEQRAAAAAAGITLPN